MASKQPQRWPRLPTTASTDVNRLSLSRPNNGTSDEQVTPSRFMFGRAGLGVRLAARVVPPWPGAEIPARHLGAVAMLAMAAPTHRHSLPQAWQRAGRGYSMARWAAGSAAVAAAVVGAAFCEGQEDSTDDSGSQSRRRAKTFKENKIAEYEVSVCFTASGRSQEGKIKKVLRAACRPCFVTLHLLTCYCRSPPMSSNHLRNQWT